MFCVWIEVAIQMKTSVYVELSFALECNYKHIDLEVIPCNPMSLTARSCLCLLRSSLTAFSGAYLLIQCLTPVRVLGACLCVCVCFQPPSKYAQQSPRKWKKHRNY